MSRNNAHFHRDVDNNEDKPASERQKEFLLDLLADADRRRLVTNIDEADVHDLSIQEASEFIDDLKSILGR